MAAGGEGRDHAHARLGLRVGGVDDTQRRLAARHQHQRRAHAFRLRQARGQAIPLSERFQRGAAVLAGRDRRRLGDGQAALTERGGDGAGPGQVDLAGAGLRRDQHQPVAQQVAAAAGIDPVTLLQVIHPLQVGGSEYLCRRALFDLPRQRRTCRVGHAHRRAGGVLVGGSGLVQRFLEARGGEHGQRRAFRRPRRGGRCEHAHSQRQHGQCAQQRNGRGRHAVVLRWGGVAAEGRGGAGVGRR